MEGKNSTRILVGLWDCPYCGAKGLNGLKKHCPNCGHPQDEETKFYLGEEKEYLDDERAKEYGQGADWTCAYCGALNRYNANFCTGCGAGKEESTGDYFDNEKKQAEKEKRRQEEIKAATAPQSQQPAEPPKKRSPLLFLLVAALVIGLFAFIFIPRNGEATVSAKEWTRILYTENYEDVQRSDWSLPADATLLSSERAIHHYDPVLDHYENVKVRRSRQVFDHYDTDTYTVNNGDGTFTEHTRQTPVYSTEYYYETERKPVYVQVPVYATKYNYVHKEWVQGETMRASGTEEDPYWPAFTETDTRRVTAEYSGYRLTISANKDKTFSVVVPEDTFTGCKIGDTVKITLSAGSLTAINGVQVG